MFLQLISWIARLHLLITTVVCVLFFYLYNSKLLTFNIYCRNEIEKLQINFLIVILMVILMGHRHVASGGGGSFRWTGILPILSVVYVECKIYHSVRCRNVCTTNIIKRAWSEFWSKLFFSNLYVYNASVRHLNRQLFECHPFVGLHCISDLQSLEFFVL